LNFIFGIVCLFVCVCAFSLRRESPDMILGDKPLILRWFCYSRKMIGSNAEAEKETMSGACARGFKRNLELGCAQLTMPN
jgi:hypothetical protein